MSYTGKLDIIHGIRSVCEAKERLSKDAAVEDIKASLKGSIATEYHLDRSHRNYLRKNIARE